MTRRPRVYHPGNTRMDRFVWSPIVTVLCWISEHFNRNIYP